MVTRRCTQRQFLLTPDDQVTNAIAYCLADAAKRFAIDVLTTTVESNHHHTVIFDRHGRFPQFIEHFHKMVAKCINALRGRQENLWSAQETCVTRLLDYETILAKLAYAAANPVKDLLVERATQWPGLSGYRYLLHRKTLRARRPLFFFRKDRGWPDEITLEFVIPAELGDREEVIQELERRVTAIEEAALRTRQASRRRICGRKTILNQDWRATPSTTEARRELRPRFAGRPDVRKEALRGYLDFLAAYREARKQWLLGLPSLFPAGTYWLGRFAPASKVLAS